MHPEFRSYLTDMHIRGPRLYEPLELAGSDAEVICAALGLLGALET